MKIKDQSVKNIGKFKLFLEGLEVPFNNIQISEAEGNFPSASIALEGYPQALRILPGTIVQVFGTVYNPTQKPKDEDYYLLFEGEVTAISYNGTSDNFGVSIRATSLLSHMITAKLKPSDVVVSKQQQTKEGMSTPTAIIKADNPKASDSINIPLITYNVYDKIKEMNDAAKPTFLKGTVDAIGTPTSMMGLADEFSVLLNKSDAKQGNYQEIIRTFNRLFELNDIYYGILSNSFKLGGSIFALPNNHPQTQFRNQCALEAISRMQKYSAVDMLNSDERLTLMQCLMQFQHYFYYRLISPAAPTAAHLFFTKFEKNDKKLPLRAVYSPNIESGPPALCNIIFPENMTSYSYQRDMISEPTRVVGRATFQITGFDIATVMPMYLVPDIKLDKKDSRLISKFNDEESYRGITLKVQEFDGIMTKVFHDGNIKNESGKNVVKEPTQSSMESGISNTLRDFTYNSYYEQKYGNRVANVQTEWSPYRIIGLPGMIFYPGRPTMVGIVSSIDTQIVANGNAISNISFRNTRIIFDEDIHKNTFNNVDQIKDEVKKLSNYVVSDFSNEGISSNNEEIFDSDFYSFENIGKDIYAYLIHGTIYKDNNNASKFLDAAALKNYKDELSQLPETINTDSSILRFVSESDKTAISNSGKEVKELYYYKLLLKAIENFKKEYNDYRKRENFIYTFIQGLTKRNLTTMTDYLDFINAKNQPNDYSDAKDLMGIFNSKTSINFNELRELLKSEELESKLLYSNYNDIMAFQKELNNQIDSLEKESKTYVDNSKEIAKLKKEKEDEGKKKSTEGSTTKIAELETKINKLQSKDTKKKNLKKKLEEFKKIKEDLDKLIAEAGINGAKFNEEFFGLNAFTSLFKPYNITRRAHVYYIFSNIRPHNITGVIPNTDIIQTTNL